MDYAKWLGVPNLLLEMSFLSVVESIILRSLNNRIHMEHDLSYLVTKFKIIKKEKKLINKK